jgi:hypothetical protein
VGRAGPDLSEQRGMKQAAATGQREVRETKRTAKQRGVQLVQNGIRDRQDEALHLCCDKSAGSFDIMKHRFSIFGYA